LFWKRLIFDGWPGVYYSLQRTFAELLLSLEILDRRLRIAPKVTVAENRTGKQIGARAASPKTD
jgi:hypothetical protein